MEDEEDLSPSGSDVVSRGVSGLGEFGRALGGLFVDGLSRRIDLEFREKEARIDTTVLNRQQQPAVTPPGLGDVIENLTPVQLGGFALVAVLMIALVSGQFRP